MNLLGVRLTLLMGPEPLVGPAPPQVLEALSEVEVVQSGWGVSGFRLTFGVGRASPQDLLDYALVSLPLLQVNTRVVVIVTFDVTPKVIMDGIVTERHLTPGEKPGEGKLELTGRDLSVVLDREEKNAEHPGQDESVIAAKIFANYPAYGLIPQVTPTFFLEPPFPLDRTPYQECSDWSYLCRLARHHGWVTYIEAGPGPGINAAYWGPPAILELQQKSLNVNLPPITNVTSFQAQQDALAPVAVESQVQDRLLGQTLPVAALFPLRPPLGAVPDAFVHAGKLRKKKILTSGLSAVQAAARAFAEADRGSDDANKLTGTLDSLRYNDVLRARAPVDVRGAGYTFDGKYLVRQVTHHIARGSYTQDFTLSRGETGALAPFVRPG